MSSSSRPLHHHREAHSSCCAHGHQTELTAAPTQLVQQRRRDARAGRTERMPDGDRAAHDVQLRTVNLADRFRKARALCPILGLKALEIRQHLSSKGFVHLDQIDIMQDESGAFQGNGCGEHWRLQQLFSRVERSVGVGPDYSEWRIAERFCLFLTHETYARASVG